jgi:hypothetical protein
VQFDFSVTKGMKRGLIVIAKEPVPGQVKTRLCSLWTLEEAAELYRRFLLDTFELAARLQGVTVTVAYFPSEAEETFKAMAPLAFELMLQRGADLGERLSGAFEQLFSLGYERVVAIGADSPTLPPAYIGWSFELLAGTELALGPSADGGYYLIGMKAFHPELFQGVAMGTERVFSQTLKRARQANLRVSLLPPWYDVDTQDDLERLRAELHATPQVAMHTRAFLCCEVS